MKTMGKEPRGRRKHFLIQNSIPLATLYSAVVSGELGWSQNRVPRQAQLADRSGLVLEPQPC
jgi:hypothetical protein